MTLRPGPRGKVPGADVALGVWLLQLLAGGPSTKGVNSQ